MLSLYVMVALGLFLIGTFGVLLRRNLVLVLLSIELMLNAVNLIFVAASRYSGAGDGRVFVFFVLTISAAEVAVGLSLVVSLYKRLSTVNIDDLAELKW